MRGGPDGRIGRLVVRAAVVAVAGALLAGCQFDGVGSLPLPLRSGVGSGSSTTATCVAGC